MPKSNRHANLITPIGLATSRETARKVFVRDLVLEARIGVYAHERHKRQRVRINVSLGLAEPEHPIDDDVANIVNYESVVEGCRAILARGHINLVETLAEQIAGHCLADQRVIEAHIRVEKLDAVNDVASVGVELIRARQGAKT